jgi:DNA modification methylase
MNREYILKELLQKYTPERIDKCIAKIKQNPMDVYSAQTILYYYFLDERLNTIMIGTNFYDFCNNFEASRPSLLKTFEKLNYKRTPSDLYKIYGYYHGRCSPFKISVAYALIQKYANDKETVLDPCAGFGGRCIATILHNKQYIGFDLNDRLKPAYELLLSHFPNHNCEINYIDALTVDYSKYKYDCIITSPPYYNIELYNNTDKRCKADWIQWYKTLFKNIYDNLMDDGVMILSINQDMYNNIFKPLFGEPISIEPLQINETRKNNYKEFVYIWKRSP